MSDNKPSLPSKYSTYDAAYSKMKLSYDALDVETRFKNLPNRNNMDLLMDWCVDITEVFDTLGSIEADARILLNRLSMLMLQLNDLPEEKDIRRSILSSSTVMKFYIDGKFSQVSRLQAEAENHIKVIRSTLDMMRSIISEHNTAQKLREVENQFRK